jgi:single-stranded-DNA-specific exonuclease
MEIIRRTPVSDFQSDIYPPILQRIFAARGISKEDELSKKLDALMSFEAMKGLDLACARLHNALLNNEVIVVIGDFDADGATSTALAVTSLTLMGAKNVHFLVPNRFEYGYGLTPDIVHLAIQQHQPQVIITVDNGISSLEGAAVLKKNGIDLIVTDHHLPGDTLPDAYAIVNPNQADCSFMSKSIAGVGVIFYVMVALRRWLISHDWFINNQIDVPNMGHCLDLVALGTVADVVALDKNNRILVENGLHRIKQGHARPGILALIEVGQRDYRTLRESDLGFVVGPRLNAAGRLDDMSIGIHCLLSKTREEALAYAVRLNELNIERRAIEQTMKQDALKTIQKTLTSLQHASLPLGICLFHPTFHQGVIGILAGRIKETYHRPTIIFAEGDEAQLKGSARSVMGLNIRDVIASIATKYPDVIIKFGGHAMAAGLTIHAHYLDDFKSAFESEVSLHLTLEACQGRLYTDGELSTPELNLLTAKVIREAGPWGQQFPEPLFDNVFEMVDQRLVGQHHLKMSLSLPDSGVIFDAIMFNVNTDVWPNHRAHRVHIAYKLDINLFKQREKLQLLVEALNIVDTH